MSILIKPIFYTIGLILKIFKIPSKFDDLRIFFPSNMKLHELGGTVTNLYESDERKLVKKYLEPQDKVLELGACVGVVSLTINSILNNKSNQISVEPNPQMFDYLMKNRANNNGKFYVETCIVSTSSSVDFSLGGDSFLGSSTRGTQNIIQVKGQTLEDLENKYFQFTALIMDIEGGEYEFFNSFDLSLSKVNLIIFETHVSKNMLNESQLKECQTRLEQYGFELIEKSGKVEAWKKSKNLL